MNDNRKVVGPISVLRILIFVKVAFHTFYELEVLHHFESITDTKYGSFSWPM